MTKTIDPAVAPAPVRLTRTLHASRKLVFEAWTTADHVQRWFAPTGFTVSQAKVEPRVGGPFEALMRAPDGVEHWARGGTRLDVAQAYTVLDPDAAWMAEGAPQGWAQTLDKLTDAIRRMQSASSGRSVVHATFTVERTYDAPVERGYRALSERAAKDKWFGGGPDAQWTPIERAMDFCVGGRERAKVRWQRGVVTTFDAIYCDIIPNERIVYTYEMRLDERKISVSLATMQVKPAGPGKATLKVTEQGAFLDGYDDAGAREHGTGFLLDKLGQSLAD